MGGTVYVGTFSKPRLVKTTRAGGGDEKSIDTDFAHVDSPRGEELPWKQSLLPDFIP